MFFSVEYFRLNRVFSMVLAMIRYVQPLYGIVKCLPMTAAEVLLSAYFRYCNLSPCSVDLDDGQTSMHIWATNHRRSDKPNLVLVHGYGGNSKWQFILQVGALARDFNVYIPDLVFFGKSYSRRAERTDSFQAKCVCGGLRRLGVEKFSVYAISYGGFVGFRMAELHPHAVEKLVVVSSGMVFTEDQRSEYMEKIGRKVVDLLVPEHPEEIRALCRMSMYNYDVSKWFPDFFLRAYIAVEKYSKEKQELVEELLSEKRDFLPPVLIQETLLIWGDKDKVFPLHLAYQLHRYLGPKSKLEIIKDVGHAANIEAASTLNRLITSFVLNY